MTIDDIIHSQCSKPEELETFLRSAEAIKKIENDKGKFQVQNFAIEDETGWLRASTFSPKVDLSTLPEGTPLKLSKIVWTEFLSKSGNKWPSIKSCYVVSNYHPIQNAESSMETRIQALNNACTLSTSQFFQNRQLNLTQVLFLASIFSDFLINKTVPQIVSQRIAIFTESLDIMKTLSLSAEEWQLNIDTLTGPDFSKANELLISLRMKIKEEKDG